MIYLCQSTPASNAKSYLQTNLYHTMLFISVDNLNLLLKNTFIQKKAINRRK